jgi:type II secretory pathway pseudopilin PulG
MNKGLKISLIVIGVAIAVSVPIIVINDRKKKERERKAKEQEALIQQNQQVDTGYQEESGFVVPVRNRNFEVINPYNEVRGKLLYPAINSKDPSRGYEGAIGTASLRSSAEVNTGYWNNLIKTYSTGEAIGTVIGETKDNLSPSMRWFKVKMSKPCCGIISDYKEGWVRADVVTFRKYPKSSSFDGSMIERYKTSYQLGAEVFPHPNWMLPNSYTQVGQAYDIDDVIMDI